MAENNKKNKEKTVEKEMKREAIKGKEYKSKKGHVDPWRRHAENEGSEYIDEKPNRKGQQINENTRDEADYDKMKGSR